MARRTLVTGGGGFLGSHLCRKLLALGGEVICVDNFRSGSRSNIADLRDEPRFKLVEADITENLAVECDEIYNLACPASPIHYQRDPVHTVRTCVYGAMNMLDLAHRQKVRILQSSTSEVYGDPNVHPQPEGYWGNVNPIGFRSCYDEGKRCAETLFFAYRRQYGTDTKIVRIFNTYGPNMLPDDGRVVSNFIVQALKNVDITIYGTGEQTRSFCYCDDLVDGMVKMMNTPPDVMGPVNLGNPAEFTILQLAELILELTGSRSKIIHADLPADDPQQRRPDIRRAQELLRWNPTTPLRVGLERTIAYFDRLLGKR